MKLILCGKGGSGKSTIAALLSKSLVKNGKSVLVVDTDESNFGLHRQLGVDLPQDFTNYFGGKMAALGKIIQASPNFESVSFFDNEWVIDNIPREYFTVKDGIKLISIGKIHEVGEGCACTMGILSKQFMANLRLNADEVVIIDTEAGIEHFGRAVEKSVDAILMVIDPSFESMKLSEKVSELSGSIEKPVYFVLNKADEANKQFMWESISRQGAIAAVIPMDTGILQAGLKGEEIMTDSDEIQRLCQFLLENLNHIQ